MVARSGDGATHQPFQARLASTPIIIPSIEQIHAPFTAVPPVAIPSPEPITAPTIPPMTAPSNRLTSPPKMDFNRSPNPMTEMIPRKILSMRVELNSRKIHSIHPYPATAIRYPLLCAWRAMAVMVLIGRVLHNPFAARVLRGGGALHSGEQLELPPWLINGPGKESPMFPAKVAHSPMHVPRMVAGAKNAPTLESPETPPLEMSKGGTPAALRLWPEWILP